MRIIDYLNKKVNESMSVANMNGYEGVSKDTNSLRKMAVKNSSQSKNMEKDYQKGKNNYITKTNTL
jgi:hypothetical protein